MRNFLILIVLIAAFAVIRPAFSQDATKAPPLPCVDVQIGQNQALALNCMNEAIAQKVLHERETPQPLAPLDARSPSNQVGTFNENAAQEQMGNSFGVSAHPQRPQSVFVSPVLAPTSR